MLCVDVLPMADFEKKMNCPSSFDLLEFSDAIVDKKIASSIGLHLSKCEFCAAEVELYTHFPPLEYIEIEPCAIPEHLYELADSIFKKTPIVFRTFGISHKTAGGHT